MAREGLPWVPPWWQQVVPTPSSLCTVQEGGCLTSPLPAWPTTQELEALKRAQKQASANQSTVEVRLNRALEEAERAKREAAEVKQSHKVCSGPPGGEGGVTAPRSAGGAAPHPPRRPTDCSCSPAESNQLLLPAGWKGRLPSGPLMVWPSLPGPPQSTAQEAGRTEWGEEETRETERRPDGSFH